MKNLHSYFVVGGGLFLLFFSTSCSTQWHLKHYSGDGEVTIIPYGGIFQGGGGCQIKFKPIKLDHPAHFTYHFKGLPARHFDCFFAIDDPRSWTDRSQYEFYQQPAQRVWAATNHFKFATYDDLKGTLAMSLKDAKGNVIFQYKRDLSKLTWSQGGNDPPELYDFDAKTWFISNRMEYTLEVTIDPDPMLKADEGFVLIRGGGREGISIGF